MKAYSDSEVATIMGMAHDPQFNMLRLHLTACVAEPSNELHGARPTGTSDKGEEQVAELGKHSQ